MSKVLVTGGSGFVGGHVILELAASGFEIRSTLRNMGREGELRKTLEAGGLAEAATLSFVPADLEEEQGWEAAVEGCEFVIHVASPFPRAVPKDENELIRPAREGALRVLRASRGAGVKRVVLTSSFGAVGYGHRPQEAPFDETSWTEIGSPDVQPYVKSKTLAERAAWDFVRAEGKDLELSVINPVGIFGPVLGPDLSGSISIIQRMLQGEMPGCPKIYFGVVDVRDVAKLHVQAMLAPEAKGERFLAVAGPSLSLSQVAKILKDNLKTEAAKVSTRQIPNWLMRVMALGNPSLRDRLPQLGKRRNSSSEKARRLLGWAPRSSEEAIVATARSLLQMHLVASSPSAP